MALGLLAEIPTMRALADADRLRAVFGPLQVAMAVGAAAALLAGIAAPNPLLLALFLGAVLTALWFFAVSRFLRADAWADAREPSSEAA